MSENKTEAKEVTSKKTVPPYNKPPEIIYHIYCGEDGKWRHLTYGGEASDAAMKALKREADKMGIAAQDKPFLIVKGVTTFTPETVVTFSVLEETKPYAAAQK